MSGTPPLFETFRMMNPGLKRPSGPARAGLLAAVIAGVVPLLAAVLLALIAGALVYAVASSVARVLAVFGITPAIGSGSPPNPAEPERENVRVRR